MRKHILLLFALLSSSLGSFSSVVQANGFRCAGGREACAEARTIYRLKRLTGKSCAGGQEACIKYLQDQLNDQRFERESEHKEQENELQYSKSIYCVTLEGKLTCLRTRNSESDQPLLFNPLLPPAGVFCDINDEGTKAACVE